RQSSPCACCNGFMNPHNKLLALWNQRQSSALFFSSQNAFNFFRSTNSAAVSANAFSLRRSSFFNWCISLLSRSASLAAAFNSAFDSFAAGRWLFRNASFQAFTCSGNKLFFRQYSLSSTSEKESVSATTASLASADHWSGD